MSCPSVLMCSEERTGGLAWLGKFSQQGPWRGCLERTEEGLQGWSLDLNKQRQAGGHRRGGVGEGPDRRISEA